MPGSGIEQLAEAARQDERLFARIAEPQYVRYGWDEPNLQQVPRRNRLRGLPWDRAVVDECIQYSRRFGLGLDHSGMPITRAKPDTWPTFLDNWSQIGLQHERASLCQPLLGA